MFKRLDQNKNLPSSFQILAQMKIWGWQEGWCTLYSNQKPFQLVGRVGTRGLSTAGTITYTASKGKYVAVKVGQVRQI